MVARAGGVARFAFEPSGVVVTKQDKLREVLAGKLGAPDDLASFLAANSGLPGPRANLELAGAFADLAARGELPEGWTDRLVRWAALSTTDAPTNHPTEFLPFVAVQALGAVFVQAGDPLRSTILSSLRAAANDARWRMREACAFGLQRIGEADPSLFAGILGAWMRSPTLRELRAVLAAWAHPPLLASEDMAKLALEAADAAMDTLLGLSEEQLRSDDGKSLVKAMGFAPSVVVAAAPGSGFALLEAWADRGSIVAAKVVAANLRKARLARHFPDEVQEVGMRLEAAYYE